MKHIVKFMIAILMTIINILAHIIAYIATYVWEFHPPSDSIMDELMDEYEIYKKEVIIFAEPVFTTKVQWSTRLFNNRRIYNNYFHYLWGDRVNDLLKGMTNHAKHNSSQK